MEAHSGLLQCYMAINDNDMAMKHVSHYKRLTNTQADMLNKKADAARHSANLNWKKENWTEALDDYKNFFKNARTDKNNKDRRLIDHARIANGLANGTYKMGKFFFLIFFRETF